MKCDDYLDYILKLVFDELTKWDEKCQRLKNNEEELQDIDIDSINSDEISIINENEIDSDIENDYVLV